MLKSLTKFPRRSLLIGIFILNLIVLFSYLVLVLIGSNILPINIIILSYPAKIISENLLILILFFFIEIISIGYYLYKNKTNKKPNTKTSSLVHSNFTNDTKNFTETDNNELFNNSIIEFNDFSEDLDLFIDDLELPSEELIDQEDKSLSPTYISDLATTLVNQPSLKNQKKTNTNAEMKWKSPEILLNDYQYGFYQSVLEKGWVFERMIDRERITLDHYALDEAKISLNDIKYLIKNKMLFKQNISHPSGSFIIYSVKESNENEIIKDIMKSFLKKNKYNFIDRRIGFQNWNEIGLQRKTWDFQFIQCNSELYGLIRINSNTNIENNESLSKELKDEIKALIATIEIKVQNNGNAFLITNSKKYITQIEKYIDSTGWGEIELFDFSDNNFFINFLNFLK